MNGPKFWNEVITRIDAVGVNQQNWDIQIAGGCIRDWYLGLTPKDIDVFVRQRNGIFNGRNIEGFEPTDGPQVADEYMGVGNIIEITNWKFVDTDIQIILINQDPGDHRFRFDAEILKGSFDHDLGLRLPPRTLKDLDDKVVRLTRNATARSQERAERFLQKVGQVEEGWTINTEDYDQAQAQAEVPQGQVGLAELVNAAADNNRLRFPHLRPGQVFAQWAMPQAPLGMAARGLAGNRVEAVMVDELPLEEMVELR